jgi:heme exporter protein D
MTKIFSLAFVFFSVPGYAPWVVIGTLLLVMGLLQAVMDRRAVLLAPQPVRRLALRR